MGRAPVLCGLLVVAHATVRHRADARGIDALPVILYDETAAPALLPPANEDGFLRPFAGILQNIADEFTQIVRIDRQPSPSGGSTCQSSTSPEEVRFSVRTTGGNDSREVAIRLAHLGTGGEVLPATARVKHLHDA